MAQETVPEDGDALEKATWPALAPFFPHHEEFWRIQLVPLRSTGSIHPPRGIDDDFQFLAMQHYLCMSLWEKPTNESWGYALNAVSTANLLAPFRVFSPLDNQ